MDCCRFVFDISYAIYAEGLGHLHWLRLLGTLWPGPEEMFQGFGRAPFRMSGKGLLKFLQVLQRRVKSYCKSTSEGLEIAMVTSTEAFHWSSLASLPFSDSVAQ